MNILPGWFPAGAVIRAGAPRSLAFEASAISHDSETITAPASIQAGDLLVLGDFAADNSDPSLTVPSGFTILNNDFHDTGFDNRLRVILSAKIADGSEAGATLTGSWASDAQGVKILAVFRPDNPASSLTGFSGDADCTDSTEQQSVTIGSNTPPLVIIAFTDSTIDTFSPSEDGKIQRMSEGGPTGEEMFYKIYNSSPQDTTINADASALASAGITVA